MAVIANRKSVMTLFSDASDIHSHRVRIVLAEKGINFDVVYVDPTNPPEDLLELSPYGAVPTLVDRDLVLYDSHVIMEYLDERFPHPPLMPVDPVSRGRTRMTLRRIQKDWDSLVEAIQNPNNPDPAKSRKELAEGLTVVAPIFQQKPFFMSSEFSLMDCVVGPILWRLPKYGIELPGSAKPVLDYAKRLFEMDSFKASLSEVENEMHL
ncbi:MAG: glutathione S-transferase N-terminal domain-containing protein [Gammaproteobacteria bacterium]|nr:glutathione S-transferase N-terminal domain-containing protein [Gammaproteobacteria bacterium]MDH5803281.1 glutathione S-transferase N-terminal domain-containing protein [Gammaproteobacteria bacterium]